MIDDKRKSFFWPSYLDLMTALFAIVLSLFAFSYYHWKKTEKDLIVKIEEYKKIEDLKKNISNLLTKSNLFVYEPEFKRYRIAQDIEFRINEYDINPGSIENYENTKEGLLELGNFLKSVIDSLREQKKSVDSLKELSYLFVMSGRSSNLPGNDTTFNYDLSYKRAYSLFRFWKENAGLDLEDTSYHKLIDFQISGNGVGGIGRFSPYEDSGKFSPELEMRNQSILLQIVPKVGRIESIEPKN